MNLNQFLRYIIIFSLIISACSKIDNAKTSQDELIYSSRVELKDSVLLENLKQYIEAYDLQSDKVILVVHLVSQGMKEVVFIENTIRQPSQRRHPSSFTTVDGFLVLIYSSLDTYIDRSNIVTEVEHYINENDISVEKELYRSYNPPIWKYTECDGYYNLYKENIPSVNETLPCGYILERDSGQIGYKVVKEE